MATYETFSLKIPIQPAVPTFPTTVGEQIPLDILCLHLARVKVSQLPIEKLLFVCVVAHESGVSSMDDCLKRQTFAASPAEPGGLPW